MTKAATELRELSDIGLIEKLAETKQELFTLRFSLATGQLDTTSQLPMLRKEVARVETILRERKIAAANATTDVSK